MTADSVQRPRQETTERRPDVRVVIPAFNDRRSLIACLESVYASHGPAPHVVVVDDASSDDTATEVRRRFPQCELSVHAQNLGFGPTCNTGLRIALERGADLVLLLNQDTVVSPSMIELLVRFLQETPAAGVVGPRTRSTHRTDDGRDRLLYAGAWRTRLPLRQRIPGIGQADADEPGPPMQVDFVWGHGMMLRASVLREVGLFDTDFPMYYEDLDLCHRVRTAGHELWCEPAALMWHDVADGARAHESEYWRWALKVVSMSVFHRKHYGRSRATLLTSLTVIAEASQLLWHGHLRAARHLLTAALRHAVGLAGTPRRTSTEAQREAG